MNFFCPKCKLFLKIEFLTFRLSCYFSLDFVVTRRVGQWQINGKGNAYFYDYGSLRLFFIIICILKLFLWSLGSFLSFFKIIVIIKKIVGWQF